MPEWPNGADSSRDEVSHVRYNDFTSEPSVGLVSTQVRILLSAYKGGFMPPTSLLTFSMRALLEWSQRLCLCAREKVVGILLSAFVFKSIQNESSSQKQTISEHKMDAR